MKTELVSLVPDLRCDAGSPFTGWTLPVYRNEVERRPCGPTLESFDCFQMSACFEKNDWGMGRILVWDSLGIRVYGSAGISFSKIRTGGILAYFVKHLAFGITPQLRSWGPVGLYPF